MSIPAGSTHLPRILDMVHHNPGEPLYRTKYESPDVLRGMGIEGKVYHLFDSPTLAVDWESVDADIFPRGSAARAWVDAKAARIDAQHAACAADGIKIYAMGDLMLLPKKLVEKHQLETCMGNPTDPRTGRFLRLLMAQVFERFPRLDGLVVRIGETYLHDAPWHVGRIEGKSDARATIIPLMRILRDELCVKRGRHLIFRTWLSFDIDLETYLSVSDAVEPHPLLTIAVKHCEGDFHRGNPFSKVLGAGRHPQLVEVQCAREYEGKGAFPNYIARGVIEGFEEHLSAQPERALRSIGELARARPDLFAGIWTWSRGGGWNGPYIKNEFWCDLNVAIMTQWARDPRQYEESIFARHATETLGLDADDAARFRRLCLLSADAVVRGRISPRGDVDPWWSRDEYFGKPGLGTFDEAAVARTLAEKDESVAMWQEIAALARQIKLPGEDDRRHLVASSEYGLRLHRIIRALFQLSAADTRNAPPGELRRFLSDYDRAWDSYKALPREHPSCATLYQKRGSPWGPPPGIETWIPELRCKAS
ncbi:hypothetical protein [Ereboglobus luteus]|uniref:Uncharacterized protein n=1 Tax=Ereboglobus luteus TaxID=1796921 RepID=A0A2U8DZW3_9BACT|nr:hypothetical protein [Ereboglobus luteus]AWI08143.1 hypothetical protein CKA38_01685 [Ereboglobus luteus]